MRNLMISEYLFCPQCGTKNPTNSNFCNSCGLDLRTIPNRNKLVPSQQKNEKKELIPKTELEQKKNPSTSSKEVIRGIIGFIVLIFILGAIGSIFSESDSDEDKERELKGYANIISENFISKQLRAPATADFPSFGSDRVKSLGKNRFKIISYVDAQNGFGAQIRTNYWVVLKYTGGEPLNDESWVLEDYKIYE